MRNSRETYHRNIYFLGLAIVIAALPLSKIALSWGQMILALNWLLETRYKSKLIAFFKNRTALIIVSLYLLHIIGLIYSTDFNYAMKDLRIKLPMFIIPFIVATSEMLNRKRFHLLLAIFIAACFASTVISIYNYFFMDFVDIREICVYVSHIRLSLMICLSVFILLYFVAFSNEYEIMVKVMAVALMIWFVYFLIILESISGLSILLCIAFILALKSAFMLKGIYRIGTLILLLALPLLLLFFLNNVYRYYFPAVDKQLNSKEKVTALGNPYIHDTAFRATENGLFVAINMCEPEMKEAWNKRSSFDYSGNDRKGQPLRFTLMRFLTSKSLMKDAEGVNKLTADEIIAVENGVTNVKLTGSKSIGSRLYETLWEFDNRNSGDPNGKSVMQRLAYWQASLGIIKEHPWMGVGTGDMNIVFANYYEKTKSLLKPGNRWRSHNQFLSITVGFGLIGLLWFLFTLLYPFTLKWVRQDYFYVVFFAILILSMTAEDTLETQTGVTFYAVFNALLLLARKVDKIIA